MVYYRKRNVQLPKPLLALFFIGIAAGFFMTALFYSDTVEALQYSASDADNLSASAQSASSIYISWTTSQPNGGTQNIYRDNQYIGAVGTGVSGYTSSGLASCTYYYYVVCSAYGCTSGGGATTTGCDPCAGVTCNSFCSGSTAYYSGYCSGGSCYYSTDNCSVGFCSGMTPYPGASCSAGSCTRTAGSACPSSTCGGSYSTTYYYSGYCSSGTCGYGASSISAGTCGAVCTPGATRTMYNTLTVACGTAIASETQTCNTYGTGWSGTYTISGGVGPSTRTRYQANTSACGTYGYSSESQDCQTNGAWTGTYTLTSPPSITTQTMYQSATVPDGNSCVSQTQTCQSNGAWSPNTYIYSSCGVLPGTPTISGMPNAPDYSLLLSYSYLGATHYTITRNGTQIVSGSSGTGYLDQGLSCGTSYTYVIDSTNAYGSNSASAVVTTSSCPPPATPTGFTATVVSQTQINLSWNSVSGATSYTLSHPGGGVLYIGSGTSYSDTGLSCGTLYSYTVLASNAGGASANASASGTTSACNISPNTPTLVAPANGTWVTSRQFCATVSDPDGGNVTAKFVIGGTTYSGSTVTSGSQSCYTHTSDLNGTTWYAYAEDPSAATSGNTATQTANIDTTAPTPNPPTVSASSTSQTSANVSMSSGTDGYSGLNATAYGFSTDGSNYAWYSSNSQTLTGLTCGVQHTIYGKIRDSLGNMTSAGTTSYSYLGAATYNESQSTGNRTSLITIAYDNIWNYSGYPDTNMIDGNTGTTAYLSTTDIAGKYITFDFGTAKVIQEARYTWYGGGAQSGTWKWQASNDNSNWTDVSASFVPNAGGNPQPTILGNMSANNTAYRYYRWIGVSGTGYNNGGAAEIEFKIAGAEICVNAPGAASNVTVSETSGGGGLTASWVAASGSPDGYVVYLKGGRTNPNNAIKVGSDITSGTSFPSYSLMGECPSSYVVTVVAYKTDASLGATTDSTCTNTFSAGSLSGASLPTGRKCSTSTSQSILLKSCTGGFLME